jgi:hypothetical protein
MKSSSVMITLVLGTGFLSVSLLPLRAEDCNGNGIDDAMDLLPSPLPLTATFEFDPIPGAGSHYPLDTKAADLDDDGHIDLAFLRIGMVEVFLNDGSGFAGRCEVDLEPTGGGRSMAAADLDLDGDVDLAIVEGSKDRLSILINDGSAWFRIGDVLTTAENPDRVTATDMNGDGAPDLFVGSKTSVLFFNDGTGTFQDRVTLTLPLGNSHNFHAIADIDGDQDQDLIIQASNRFFVFTNSGIGTFGEPAKYEYQDHHSFYGILAADLNVDGCVDLVTYDNWIGVSVFPNSGDGFFLTPRDFSVGSSSSMPEFSVSDYDSDGYLDLFVGMNTGIFQSAVILLKNDGGGGFGMPQEILSFTETMYRFRAADVNGDGKMDFLITKEDSVELYLASQTLPLPFSQDVNGDGIPDECQILERPRFHRADPTGDGLEDISDPIFILQFLFLGGPAPGCRESADADNSGKIELTDAIVILNHLFLGGSRPADPGPPPEPCGPDPDSPGSPGDLGCRSYRPCNP